MNPDLRWIIVLIANFFIILLAGEMNHHLAPLSLHVFAGGLLITFGALRLQLKPAFLANALTALLVDAMTPMTPGVMFLGLMAVHTLIFASRGNIPRESSRAATAVAVGANTLIMLLLALSFAREAVHPAAYWQRMSIDILLSQVIVAIGATWFFSLQMASLRLVGINLDAEQREAQ